MSTRPTFPCRIRRVRLTQVPPDEVPVPLSEDQAFLLAPRGQAHLVLAIAVGLALLLILPAYACGDPLGFLQHVPRACGGGEGFQHPGEFLFVCLVLLLAWEVLRPDSASVRGSLRRRAARKHAKLALLPDRLRLSWGSASRWAPLEVAPPAALQVDPRHAKAVLRLGRDWGFELHLRSEDAARLRELCHARG